MKLVQTSVTETAVHMRYADHTDPSKAAFWVDFQVPLIELKVPAGQGEDKLGNPELRLLSEAQLGALRYARGLIGDETQRLSKLLDPTRR